MATTHVSQRYQWRCWLRFREASSRARYVRQTTSWTLVAADEAPLGRWEVRTDSSYGVGSLRWSGERDWSMTDYNYHGDPRQVWCLPGGVRKIMMLDNVATRPSLFGWSMFTPTVLES